ncbi:putative membrane protein [Marinomonas sp. MED121]|uniref:MFS transporter n=1 Tax=Marinomonas sp. MED121 TaxID=314277 RepID=UPI000069059B|nr:MFS transporter [Marinomonas sp. MED121]EAQ63643.1 putative membrane protein [Marinomonas sp. MED121]
MKRSIWSEKQYFTYLSGSIFSTQGLWIQRMTLGWILWQASYSESLLGLLAFLLFVPSIILGPLFGVLVDRFDKRKAALQVVLILALLSLTLALMTQYKLINEINLLVLSLLLGITNSAYQSLRLAFVPELASQENMSKVVAINAVIYNSSRFIGPMIAGYLIKHYGNALSLYLVACFYLPLILVLLKLRFGHMQTKKASFTFIEDIKSGINFALSSRLISRLLILMSISAVLGRGLLEILPAAADMLYQGGVDALAWLNSVAGIGAILAGLMLTKCSNNQLLLALKLAICSSGVLILSLNFFESLTQGLVLVACLSFCATVCGVCTQALIQISVKSEFRGRVMSLWGAINLGGAAIGGLLFGFMTEFFNYELTFLLLGSLCTLIALLSSFKLTMKVNQ